MALRSFYFTHRFSHFSLRFFVQEFDGRVEFCSVTVLAGPVVAELDWSAYRLLCVSLLQRARVRRRGSFSVALPSAEGTTEETEVKVEFSEAPALLRRLLTFSCLRTGDREGRA